MRSVVATPDPLVGNLLKTRGFKTVFEFSTQDPFIALSRLFSKVILFESNHIVDTFDTLKVLMNSTVASIIVVTTTHAYPMRLYYAMGAKLVIYSKNHNLSYLIH
jgi:hypothetical protein